jgi:transcriptional regulator with XRE-family HTH domain
MITNERQYRITRAEAERFKRTLAALAADGDVRENVHPRLIQAEREAIQSQLDDLLTELAEYEKLKSGGISVITIGSFDELAEGLIKARIASGLSQKALADRLHLKEQQIQRYEAERYASASFHRLQAVARAIGLQIRKEILLPFAPTTFKQLIEKLRQVGLDRDLFLHRLLPSPDAARVSGQVEDTDQSALIAKAVTVLNRVFGWSRDVLLGTEPLTAPTFAAAEARFKMPARRSQRGTSLYAAYANYLAVTVLEATSSLQTRLLPRSASALKNDIITGYGSLNLETALHYCWDLGIPVLPLRDRGSFHGACWRYKGRNVIVLKQTSKYEARWLFDVIHELFHAGQKSESPTFEVIEGDETGLERRTSDDEIEASQFAGDVILNVRANELAEMCVDAAEGSVERLKRVVPAVAKREDVAVGALANYIAFRLSWQGIDWWGAAANLQERDRDPWIIARDVFLARFPFSIQSELDRHLLERALQ